MIDIKIDLLSDLKKKILDNLNEFNISVNQNNLDDFELLYQHRYWIERSIEIKPRKVHVSNSFIYPKAYKDQIDKIIDDFTMGVDMECYISTRIENLTFTDKMLNDWGIFHLHLGKVPYPRNLKFKDRTKELIFARITEDDVYLIGVYNHGKWHKQELVKILHDNWPDSLKKFRLFGINGTVVSDEEKLNIRTNNGNIAQLMEDGTLYTPIGGGCTSSGHNLKIKMEIDYILYKLKFYEDYIKSNADYFVKKVHDESGIMQSKLVFELIDIEDGIRVKELESGIIFNVIDKPTDSFA